MKIQKLVPYFYLLVFMSQIIFKSGLVEAAQAAEVRYGADGHLETRENLAKFYLLTGCGGDIGNPSSLLESVH